MVNAILVVGFTGTRKGMTTEQRKAVEGLLEKKNPVICLHGDAIGADAQFDAICRNLRIPRIAVPGVDGLGYPKDRAYCESELVIDKKQPFLVRNRMIVSVCDLLIAAPATVENQPRGGTCYTIRFAKKQQKYTVIVAPDGTIVEPEVWINAL